MNNHVSPFPWKFVERVTYRTVEPGVEEPDYAWIEIRDDDDNLVATLPAGSIYDAELITHIPKMIEVMERANALVNEAISWKPVATRPIIIKLEEIQAVLESYVEP